MDPNYDCEGFLEMIEAFRDPNNEVAQRVKMRMEKDARLFAIILHHNDFEVIRSIEEEHLNTGTDLVYFPLPQQTSLLQQFNFPYPDIRRRLDEFLSNLDDEELRFASAHLDRPERVRDRYAQRREALRKILRLLNVSEDELPAIVVSTGLEFEERVTLPLTAAIVPTQFRGLRNLAGGPIKGPLGENLRKTKVLMDRLSVSRELFDNAERALREIEGLPTDHTPDAAELDSLYARVIRKPAISKLLNLARKSLDERIVALHRDENSLACVRYACPSVKKVTLNALTLEVLCEDPKRTQEDNDRDMRPIAVGLYFALEEELNRTIVAYVLRTFGLTPKRRRLCRTHEGRIPAYNEGRLINTDLVLDTRMPDQTIRLSEGQPWPKPLTIGAIPYLISRIKEKGVEVFPEKYFDRGLIRSIGEAAKHRNRACHPDAESDPNLEVDRNTRFNFEDSKKFFMKFYENYGKRLSDLYADLKQTEPETIRDRRRQQGRNDPAH